MDVYKTWTRVHGLPDGPPTPNFRQIFFYGVQHQYLTSYYQYDVIYAFQADIAFYMYMQGLAKDQQVELIFVHHRRKILLKKRERVKQTVFQAEKNQENSVFGWLFFLPSAYYLHPCIY